MWSRDVSSARASSRSIVAVVSLATFASPLAGCGGGDDGPDAEIAAVTDPTTPAPTTASTTAPAPTTTEPPSVFPDDDPTDEPGVSPPDPGVPSIIPWDDVFRLDSVEEQTAALQQILFDIARTSTPAERVELGVDDIEARLGVELPDEPVEFAEADYTVDQLVLYSAIARAYLGWMPAEEALRGLEAYDPSELSADDRELFERARIDLATLGPAAPFADEVGS